MEILKCNNCGSSRYRTEVKGNNLVAYCIECGKYIKNIATEEPGIYFGKYKGLKISQFDTPEKIKYLHWLIQSDVKLTNRTRAAIYNHLNIK